MITLIGYSDGRKTYLTSTVPHSSFWSRDKARATKPYKGIDIGGGFNPVYATKISKLEVNFDVYRLVTVYSGYEPYSSEWYRDAERQGVCSEEVLANGWY